MRQDCFSAWRRGTAIKAMIPRQEDPGTTDRALLGGYSWAMGIHVLRGSWCGQQTELKGIMVTVGVLKCREERKSNEDVGGAFHRLNAGI